MPKHLLSILFLFFTVFISAQIDSMKYSMVLYSTGAYNRTNIHRSFFTVNGLQLSARKNDLKANFNNKWQYGTQGKTLINNDFSSLFDLNLYKTFPHFYYWGLFSFQSLYSLRINNQVQFGGGIAYNLVDQKTKQVNISEGVLYDYSDVFLNDTLREFYETPRNSFRLQLKYIYKQKLSSMVSAYLQNSLTNQQDYIIKVEGSLAFSILKWISLTTKCNYNRFNRNKKESLLVTYGFNLSL